MGPHRSVAQGGEQRRAAGVGAAGAAGAGGPQGPQGEGEGRRIPAQGEFRALGFRLFSLEFRV